VNKNLYLPGETRPSPRPERRAPAPPAPPSDPPGRAPPSPRPRRGAAAAESGPAAEPPPPR
ncbi:unnamed protein product, partial [Bubo scandiacus]